MKIKKLLIGACVLLTIPATAQMFSNSYQFPQAGNNNNGVGTNAPTNFLDINGDLRIRTVTQNNNLNRILGIDNNGVVQWIPSTTIGGPDNDWQVAGANMFNLNTGNVAVGHTNPDWLFHVQNGFAGSGSRIGIGSVEWIEDRAFSLRIGSTGGPLNSFHPNVDCQTDLGTAALRFDRLFLCTGIFQVVSPGPKGLAVIPNTVSLDYIRTLKVLDNGEYIQLDPSAISSFMPQAVDDPSTRVDYDESGNALPAEGSISINMTALTPHMIGAIREVDNQLQECCMANSKTSEDVDKLNEQIENLEEEVNELKALLMDLLPAEDRAKLNGARLNQNTPNPVKSQTNIGFFIPTDAQEARIVINNAEGSQVDVIELTNRGEGGQDIDTSRWSNSGVYYYSLIVDGELISTRKMILNQ